MLDEKLLSILVCPADRGPLLLIADEGACDEFGTSELLYNPRLRRAYRIEDGIPVLLIDEARNVGDEAHERFMKRAAPEDRR